MTILFLGGQILSKRESTIVSLESRHPPPFEKGGINEKGRGASPEVYPFIFKLKC